MTAALPSPREGAEEVADRLGRVIDAQAERLSTAATAMRDIKKLHREGRNHYCLEDEAAYPCPTIILIDASHILDSAGVSA